MSENIAQDPNINQTPIAEDYDTARVSTSIGESGGTTPVYKDWKPERIDKEPKNRNKLAAAFALGGVAATAILGAGAYFGIRSIANDQAERLTGNETYSSAPANPSIPTQEIYTDPALLGKYDLNENGQLDREERDVMMPVDYLEIDPEVRASDRAERFTTYLSSAYETIQPYLTPEEKEVLYMPDLNKPRAEWSDQDYLNYYTLAQWLATTQANDTAEGQRAFSAIVSQEQSGFGKVYDRIEDQPGNGLKTIMRAEPTALSNIELPAGKVGDVTLGEDGGRLVGHSLVGKDTSDIDYTLFSNWSDEKNYVLSVAENTYDSIDSVDLVELIGKYGSK